MVATRLWLVPDGVLDLTAKLTRGDISRAARYTPLVALHQAGNDWLNGALLAGHTEDFSYTY